jgi:DNA-binding NarL/FixJ family response regulator
MSIDFSTKTILIVDDQLLVRSLLSQLLKSLGFRPDAISQASDGNTALRVLDLRPVDLILCDFQMEPINGMDLLKEVRCARTQNSPNVPFVFLSGHPERATILLAAQFHVDGFIVKPPTPSDIEKNIHAALVSPRPAIDPFRYLPVATGSEYDQSTFYCASPPPQTPDLKLLLDRFRVEVALDDVVPGSLLAEDLLSKDGQVLLIRGIRLSQLQLNILKRCQQQYGVHSLPIAHLPQDQMIMYRETYGL